VALIKPLKAKLERVASAHYNNQVIKRLVNNNAASSTNNNFYSANKFRD
jgi:hypothetical protein